MIAETTKIIFNSSEIKNTVSLGSLQTTNRVKKLSSELAFHLMSIDYDGNSKATDLPVEKGANITDNVTNEPIQINLDGIVSNAYEDDLNGDTAREVFELLEKHRELATKITLVTKRFIRENLVIERFSDKRSSSDDSLYFSLSLKQILTAHTEVSQKKIGKNTSSDKKKKEDQARFEKLKALGKKNLQQLNKQKNKAGDSIKKAMANPNSDTETFSIAENIESIGVIA